MLQEPNMDQYLGLKFTGEWKDNGNVSRIMCVELSVKLIWIFYMEHFNIIKLFYNTCIIT